MTLPRILIAAAALAAVGFAGAFLVGRATAGSSGGGKTTTAPKSGLSIVVVEQKAVKVGLPSGSGQVPGLVAPPPPPPPPPVVSPPPPVSPPPVSPPPVAPPPPSPPPPVVIIG